MGTRVPVPHPYSLRPASSFIGGSLHDLNTVETRTGEIDGISDVDRDAVTEDSLGNDDESTSVDCIHDSYRNSLPLHGVGVDEERSDLENSGRLPSPSYSTLTIEDVSPIESARARFLQIVIEHFVKQNVVEVGDSSDVSYGHGHDKNKRKLQEVLYEGDPRFVLPLMYVANLYETLVNDVNVRLSSLDGIREKTIGVALEAAGGLYRKLAKKFPRKGPCSFKRRELATSLETRTRFPELVVQEEKRVRFVVVNGLMIIEKPNSLSVADADWFKRLTGRHEVSISARDYKFYSPRHKYRRVQSQSVSNIGMGTYSGSDSSCPLPQVAGFRPINEHPNQHHPLSKLHVQQLQHQPQFHTLPHGHQQPMQQSQHVPHFSHIYQCTHSSHVPDIAHQHQSPTMPQHLSCLQTLPGVHVGGRLHLLPTSPAKFCDECGAPYLRETSKFCSECGTKRLGT
ncbi:Uncharacterized protein AXF42_Ash000815 [Apostasia shenzhenica]|uniref:Uncharacterized protein n=1 Tax=Apostasia shenzhenica TaxID=1088818 RepID=A0A2I0AT45_9ASPA|nr:Uncharacterized protein AXF42_Ash000815 [Apostasia shenzhenica]